MKLHRRILGSLAHSAVALQLPQMALRYIEESRTSAQTPAEIARVALGEVPVAVAAGDLLRATCVLSDRHIAVISDHYGPSLAAAALVERGQVYLNCKPADISDAERDLELAATVLHRATGEGPRVMQHLQLASAQIELLAHTGSSTAAADAELLLTHLTSLALLHGGQQHRIDEAISFVSSIT